MKQPRIFNEVGNTPMVRLEKIEKHFHLPGAIYAKVESQNPSGSVKDRPARLMLMNAINSGLINESSTIIEATSGNFGISLALFSSHLGLPCMIIMPSNASLGRIKMLERYRAKVILTDASLGMKGANDLCEKMMQKNENYVWLNQFNSPINPLAHYETTGAEILKSVNDVDAIIAGIGTGGTISGIGRYAKEHNPNIRIIGAEPTKSAVINGHPSGIHAIAGIGAGFIPNTLWLEYIDEVDMITDEEAFAWRSAIMDIEHIGVGISSGANLAAAVHLLQKTTIKNPKIVVIFPDGDDRYDK